MNELEFRTRLLQNPNVIDEDMQAYLEANPDVKVVLKSSRQFEQHLVDAMQVEVPEGLEARILLNQSYANMPKKNRMNSWLSLNDLLDWLQQRSLVQGMAASLLVALLTVGVLRYEGSSIFGNISSDMMIEHVVAHLEEDPDVMEPDRMALNLAELQSLFAEVGGTLNAEVDELSYAGECVIQGQKGLHLVMQSPDGPVTIIVMPGQQLAALHAFESSRYQGELIPVKGAVVAIVGETPTQVAMAHMHFFKKVKFA